MTNDHQCVKSLIEIFLYIDDQLDDERLQEINEHLSYCQRCYGRVEFERMIQGYVKNNFKYEDVPSSVKSSIEKMFTN
jgi:anti-sigma factor RsiW